MKRRLQITMKTEDLRRRIDESIATNEQKMTALDARICAREGDKPYDVRVEDGLESLEELESERRHLGDRATELTLLRDGLVPNESHALNKSDLRLAGLISAQRADTPDFEGENLTAGRVWPGTCDDLLAESASPGLDDTIAEALRWRADANRRPPGAGARCLNSLDDSFACPSSSSV